MIRGEVLEVLSFADSCYTIQQPEYAVVPCFTLSFKMHISMSDL